MDLEAGAAPGTVLLFAALAFAVKVFQRAQGHSELCAVKEDHVVNAKRQAHGRRGAVFLQHRFRQALSRGGGERRGRQQARRICRAFKRQAVPKALGGNVASGHAAVASCHGSQHQLLGACAPGEHAHGADKESGAVELAVSLLRAELGHEEAQVFV